MVMISKQSTTLQARAKTSPGSWMILPISWLSINNQLIGYDYQTLDNSTRSRQNISWQLNGQSLNNKLIGYDKQSLDNSTRSRQNISWMFGKHCFTSHKAMKKQLIHHSIFRYKGRKWRFARWATANIFYHTTLCNKYYELKEALTR
jgi:hypothetical protein